MEGIVARLWCRDKRRLHRKVQICRDARLRTRYLIILNLGDGISASETAKRLDVSRNTVYRVARPLREIRRLLEDLPADEQAFWEDEVDIHLNPKIGLDWTVRGQQKEVLTPGQNVKPYLAGAQNVRSGELIWVAGKEENSVLFLWLLGVLVRQHREAKLIRVILDNYSIHHTQQVQAALPTPEGQ